jgi:hypothetical protein
MKIEIVKFIISALIGALVYAQFQPEPKKETIVQTQLQECKATIVKKTNPDGSVDEITEFYAKQKQEQKPNKVNKFGLDLGLASNKKAAIELQYNKWSYEVLTDFNKDHTHVLKYKVLEF